MSSSNKMSPPKGVSLSAALDAPAGGVSDHVETGKAPHNHNTEGEDPFPYLCLKCSLQAGPSNEGRQEDVRAGSSKGKQHAAQPDHSTRFEAEWARLPPAITNLPSSIKIKELVLRNMVGPESFRKSLPVEANGLDLCFASRPTFHEVIFDIEHDPGADEITVPADRPRGSRQSQKSSAFSESMWEGHFGVPRHLTWYSASALFADGVNSCSPLIFKPSDPSRLGLAQIWVSGAPDVVHCALAGTKRPPVCIPPPVGLLYTVVQGSLLLISWPCTEHNFQAWIKSSHAKGKKVIGWDVIDELQDPKVNMLGTGDSVYLASGTANVMVALSHVAMTSRMIWNPTAIELETISRCCHRLIDTYIAQQKKERSSSSSYSSLPLLETNLTVWTRLVKQWTHGKAGKNNETGTPLQALLDFRQDIHQVRMKIQHYRKLVHDAAREAGLRPLNVTFVKFGI